MKLIKNFLTGNLESTAQSTPRKQVWLAIRSDSTAGDGTRENPFNASEAELFDALMDDMPGNALIHLGPGTFRTRGGGGVGTQGLLTAWQPKPGQKIVGSGMFCTTLLLTLDSDPHDPADRGHTRRISLADQVPVEQHLSIPVG